METNKNNVLEFLSLALSMSHPNIHPSRFGEELRGLSRSGIETAKQVDDFLKTNSNNTALCWDVISMLREEMRRLFSDPNSDTASPSRVIREILSKVISERNHMKCLIYYELIQRQLDYSPESFSIIRDDRYYYYEYNVYIHHLMQHYFAIQMPNEVIRCYNTTKKIGFNSPILEAYYILALQIIGNTDQAIEATRNAIEKYPDDQTLRYYAIEYIKQGVQGFQKPTNESVNCITAFTNAKLYEGQNYRSAWREYLFANKALAKKFPYPKEVIEQRGELIRDVFSADFFNQRSSWGNRNKNPIIIVGMPRSGTTLLDRIVSSANGVVSLDEFGMGLLIADQFQINRSTNELNQIRNLSCNDVDRAERELKYRLPLMDENASFVDSNPFNMFELGLIKLMYPNAIIIHIDRNSVDTCLSNFCTLFSQHGHPYLAASYSLRSIGHLYLEFEKMIGHWKSIFPEIITINYESMIQNPNVIIPKLINDCGLEWNENCLHPELNPAYCFTVSNKQVRSPLNNKSIGKWKNFGIWRLLPLAFALGKRHIKDWK